LAARLIAGALVISLLAGCGGTSRRTVVGRYIQSVNAIEAKLAGPLLAVSKADRDFTHRHPNVASVLTRLRRGRADLHRLAGRLAALPAPPEALKLQSLLDQLLGREQELIGEVEQMAMFIPAFGKALAQLAPADAVLKRTLAKKAATPTAKAAALDRFRARIAVVEAQLRDLRPPPASRPTWAAQIETLERVTPTVEALAAALRAKDASALPKLVHEFDLAAAGNQTRAAQRAQIAAVVSYNHRIKQLDTLGMLIAREEAHLQRTVP
jgi:hypothetical protein